MERNQNLKGAFIGIDSYAAPQIRDLTGAARDATALWALFSDTFNDGDFELLKDASATRQNVLSSLQTLLDSASTSDTIILSFAGHGTRDERLVCHDTDPARIPETTIDFELLADGFKRSSAGVILVVLDCCFSGAAPARVFETSPALRDHTHSIERIAGKGRLLLAASRFDEPALEDPATRHGLLSKALIESLQDQDSSFSLPSVIDSIMQRVRTEAARLGHVQTPVLYGEIEGGVVFPPLKAGKLYFNAFPELKGIRVTADIDDLKAFGLPTPILAEWKTRLSSGLNSLQLKAVNDTRILDGHSAVVVAPTSSGKTFIGELASCRALVEGRKAVFLLPYRALVNEKFDDFSELYGDRLKLRVIRCTGDYSDQVNSFVRGKYDLALFTYEMFLNLAVTNPSVITQIGLIVVDEAQFITDPNRGLSVELILTFILMMRDRGISPQVLCLSAVIGDINDFDDWLNVEALMTFERPVPLIEGVLGRDGRFRYVDAEGDDQIDQLLPSELIQQRREKPSAQDIIVPLLKQLTGQGEKVIVFRNQKGRAEGAATYLANELGLPPADTILDALPTHDLPSTSAQLRTCLQGGTAFHNTNLLREERIAVERGFRDPNGRLRVLAATTTVAAGINTPASTVVLAESEFVGEDGRPFTVSEYKNMAGRAGRLGFNEKGKAILIAQTDYEADALFRRYVKGQLEKLQSTFDPKHLDTWIIRLLAQIDRVNESDIVRLLMNTYGGYRANKMSPAWATEIKVQLEVLLRRMIELQLLERTNGFVQLTLLGRACGQSALSFASSMRLVELVRSIPPGKVSAESLIALVQALPEANDDYTPMFKKGNKESARPIEMSQRFGSDLVFLMQSGARDSFVYYARCKRASILHDWISGVAVNEIETRYTVTPFQGKVGYGNIRSIADSTRFRLRSASQIISLLLIDSGPDAGSVDQLLRRLEVGLPSEVLPLLELPLRLERGEYLALREAPAFTPQDVKSLGKAELERILGKRRAAQLIALLN